MNMSRNPPRKVSKSEIKSAVAKLVKTVSHLGKPRRPTIAETVQRFPCLRCADEGKEKTVCEILVAFGGDPPNGYALFCKKCNSLHAVSTHKEDAQSLPMGKFLDEAVTLAANNGWDRGERLLQGLSGKLGYAEMEECVRYIGTGDMMIDFDFWKSLAKGLGQTDQVIINWNGIAAQYPYWTFLYFVLLDVTIRNLDEEQFWSSALQGRLESWLATTFNAEVTSK
jgi:hypothetical protein